MRTPKGDQIRLVSSKGDLPPQDYQLHKRLGFKLSRLSRVMQSRLEAQLAHHGLTRLTWCVLVSVAHEARTTPSDLADHIGITRPAMSRLIRGLIAEGLIERGVAKADGRSREISLTQKGQGVLAACWPMVEENQQHFASKLSQSQRDALNVALDQLLEGEMAAFDDL